MAMVRVAILGASGYTGLELIRLLLRNPKAEITALATRQAEAPQVAEVHPSLTGQLELRMEQLSVGEIAKRADCVFSCLPHGASAEMVEQLLAAGVKVVDFSADYRLTDHVVYEKWYGVKHPNAERMAQTVYGLPEFFRKEIKDASLVANPGCYPTSAILALAPLLRERLISPEGIIVDSKSGVSGAGRNTKPNLHYPECNESFSAYGVGTHRHMPEIDQLLTTIGGKRVEVIFTPHLVPMDRGILSTCYATPAGGATAEKCRDALRAQYLSEPFVHVRDELPTTKDVAGSNHCHLAVHECRGRVIVVSVIDNLIKGASGAAVQNFNLMYGFDETTALLS
jgi:N-acetyl-gamma-glutamyl-phosphate reductase